MPLTTPQALISLSLRATGVLGVGQTALAEDYSDAFDVLNGMIALWNRRRYLIYRLIDTSVTATGAQYYTVGPGGDFDVPRPDRLENGCFTRQIVQSQPNQVDYPLTLLESREDYNLIALKTLASSPSQAIWYDPEYPVGKVYPWPITLSGQYEIHLALKATIPPFTSYVQSVNLPDEYKETIWTNLTLRLGAIYPGVKVADDLRGLAKASLETIRSENAAIPRLRMPAGLARGSLYNIRGDNIY